MTKKIIPDVVSSMVVHTLPPSSTVQHASEVMANQSIGVMVILEDQRLVGIFSERDLLTRVVAAKMNAQTTLLSQVMTRDIVTIGPDASIYEALSLMRHHHCRHLPVMQRNRVVAMVSVRDLYRVLCEDLQEDLRAKEAFIFNSY